ncbi:hypothetical protein [Shewanella algae]|uniref:hypothetical protein n=1 Tax=Shewanella algae TaxID=38313 RepID=UPI0031F4DBB8
MSLKDMFGVPEENALEQVKYKAKGTMAQNEYWTYEERDPKGNLVSTIEHWDCTSLNNLKTDSGYRKYDPSGKLIEEKL